MTQAAASAGNSVQASKSDRKPIDTFRNGPVQVSIWENNGAKGAFRAATIQLRYKDGDGAWRTGASYGATDLEHLENAAKEARLRIENWQSRQKAQGASAVAG